MKKFVVERGIIFFFGSVNVEISTKFHTRALNAVAASLSPGNETIHSTSA